MSIEAILRELADAHGASALAQAHARLQGEVRRRRKRDRETLGVLAQSVSEAMRIWETQRLDGVSLEERAAGLERTLRAAWPKGRTEPWKELCSRCRDYGAVYFECPGDATCRPEQSRSSHLPHEFIRACWCPIGKRFRPPVRTEQDDFTTAGRKGKARGWSRVGR